MLEIDYKIQGIIAFIAMFTFVSTINFMDNLNFTLKTYTMILINFFKDTWIVVFLIFYLILMVSIAWIVFM
jgi:hypothetical protein